VLSCVQEVGKPMEQTDGWSLSVPAGTVVDEVLGAIQGGCLERQLQLQTNGAALSGQARSWTLSDGKRVYDVEVVVEGQQIPSLRGEKVSLDYVYKFGGFGPTYRELHLASLTSSSHGVWTAEGGDLNQLGKLPLILQRGPAVCSASETCGSYERYDITASDPGAMNVIITVPHGQSATLGPWVVTHGGYEEQTSTRSMCADWFVADVRLAILGRM